MNLSSMIGKFTYDNNLMAQNFSSAMASLRFMGVSVSILSIVFPSLLSKYGFTRNDAYIMHFIIYLTLIIAF